MFLRLIQTADHKQIGMLYLVTSFGFFLIGGVMALLMRGELGYPGLQFLSPEQYNQLFTMHGTVMMLLYATPNVFAFANLILPLQIGAPDVAFPRLNALSYWLYLFGALITIAGFGTPGGAADFGWFAYTPLSRAEYSPGVGGGRRQPVGGRSDHGRSRHDPRCGQHADHRDHVAGTGNDDVADADLHLEHLLHLDSRVARLPGADGGTVRAAGRPADRRVRVRPRQRGVDPVTAPVLVLRSSRGLHRRAALLRHHQRGHPGVQPQAPVRLQGFGVRHHRYHRAVDDRVGTPHVRHRRRAAAVLLAPVLHDRRADRDQVLQLDRHHVEGAAHVRDTDAVLAGLPRHVPLRRAHRSAARRAADRLPRARHVLRGRALPLRPVRHHRVRDLRRHLLLVPEDDRPDAERTVGAPALLD